MGSLLTSEPGREILTDMVHAAAGLHGQFRRTGQEAQEVSRAMVHRGTDVASTAVQVGTEAASGAVDTDAEITAAAIDVAQMAARTLAGKAGIELADGLLRAMWAA